MSESNAFRSAIEIILRHEGGFVDNPNDKGGRTNMGISQRSYPDLVIQDLTREDVKKLYHRDYWKKMRCDKLPFGVALVLFDFGVNAGTGTAVKTLQRAIGAKADGVIGPQTLGMVEALNPAYVIERLSIGRMMHYTGLDTFKTFGRGWTTRTLETMATALLARDRIV